MKKIILTILLISNIYLFADYEDELKKYQSVEFLNKTASEINKTLPMMVNRSIRLDSISGIEKNMIYYYTIMDYEREKYTNEYIKNVLKKKVKNAVCSSSGISNLPRHGVTITYKYYSNKGYFLYSIDIKPTDCNFE